MKNYPKQMNVLLLLLMVCAKINDVVPSSECNQAVLNLYGWCEQWICTDNCTCAVHSDCRQYCDTPTCKDMRCLSPSICKQKVHANGRMQPHVRNMFARSPFVTQDCSGGICDVVRAKGHWRRVDGRKRRKQRAKKGEAKRTEAVNRFKETRSAALQNCIGGVCQRLVSTLQITKQFCTDCVKVHCMGIHATNCTQVCAKGRCHEMICEADDCQQACLQNSTCTLSCSKDAKTCLQICEKGSNCKMSCNANNCKQICGDNSNCQRIQHGVNVSKEITPTTGDLSSLMPTAVNNHTKMHNASIDGKNSIAFNLTTPATNVSSIQPSTSTEQTRTNEKFLTEDSNSNLTMEQKTRSAGSSSMLCANVFSWLLTGFIIGVLS